MIPSPVLDHIVIDVRDRMDEAAETFRALGFQLTPRGHHTLGSSNHLAMFESDYLELLGFGDGGAMRAELQPFPIGLNGLVFKTRDAEAVHHHAAAGGLAVFPTQEFSRPVVLDGAERQARFRTTRLDPARVPMGRVYFCEHRTPELVWRPEWQAHANGAQSIARVVVATDDPARTASLFATLFGPDAIVVRGRDRLLAAGTAQVECVTPAAAAAEFGDACDPAGRTEYLAAVVIRVASMTGAEAAMRSVDGVVRRDRGETPRLVVPARIAFNTTLVFTE